jgi:hypothetical protein
VVKRVRWHGPETLQGTGSIDANEFQFMTDMTMAGAASRAITAWRERAHGYAITRRETFYDRAKRGDGAGHLVTENLGNVDAVIHGAMENVKVGTTDATIGNLDLHFGGLRRNRRAFADAYRLAPFVECRLEMTHRDLPLRDGTTKKRGRFRRLPLHPQVQHLLLLVPFVGVKNHSFKACPAQKMRLLSVGMES